MKKSVQKRILKLAQAVSTIPTNTNTTTTTFTNALAHQDARTLQGVKQYLFTPQNWVFVNKIVDMLNNAIFDLGKGQKVGGTDLNFKTIILNPSIITGYTGSAKSFIRLILFLWKYLSIDNITSGHTVAYSKDQIFEIVDALNQQISSLQFNDTASINYKTKITNILNNWKSAV